MAEGHENIFSFFCRVYFLPLSSCWSWVHKINLIPAQRLGSLEHRKPLALIISQLFARCATVEIKCSLRSRLSAASAELSAWASGLVYTTICGGIISVISQTYVFQSSHLLMRLTHLLTISLCCVSRRGSRLLSGQIVQRFCHFASPSALFSPCVGNCPPSRSRYGGKGASFSCWCLSINSITHAVNPPKCQSVRLVLHCVTFRHFFCDFQFQHLKSLVCAAVIRKEKSTH